MSAVSPIILLLLVSIVKTSASPDTKAYFQLQKDFKDHPSAARGTKLLWDVVRSVGAYYCSVGNDECSAFQKYLEEADLEEKETSDPEMKENLVADADKIFRATHDNFLVMDNIRIFLTRIICANEPTECPFWRLVPKLIY